MSTASDNAAYRQSQAKLRSARMRASDFVTAYEFAQRLGVVWSEFQRALAAGELPPHQTLKGGIVVFKAADVEKEITSRLNRLCK